MEKDEKEYESIQTDKTVATNTEECNYPESNYKQKEMRTSDERIKLLEADLISINEEIKNDKKEIDKYKEIIADIKYEKRKLIEKLEAREFEISRQIDLIEKEIMVANKEQQSIKHNIKTEKRKYNEIINTDFKKLKKKEKRKKD
jgi:hypothetical protein